jgi:hypothetical protein
MAWQTYKVELKGEDQPIEVQPNALDWRAVRLDPQLPMDGMWQAVHRALVRTGAPVPRDFEGFLEALDGMPEIADDGAELGPLDPTNQGP